MMNICHNHDTLLCFQSIDPHATENPTSKYGNKPDIISLNKKLVALKPAGRLAVEVVGSIALTIFSCLAAVFIAKPLVIFFATLSLLSSYYLIFNYKGGVSKIKDMEKEVSDLFKKYTKEFLVLEKVTKYLLVLSAENWKMLKPWHQEIGSECLSFDVWEQIHFKLSGGEMGTWKIKPLKLDTMCKRTNSEKVLEKYKPWLDLFMEFSKNEKIPRGFTRLVLKMAGFKSNLEERINFFNDKKNDLNKKLPSRDFIMCSYLEKSIMCIYPLNELVNNNVKIQTVEECRAFVENNFLQE